MPFLSHKFPFENRSHYECNKKEDIAQTHILYMTWYLNTFNVPNSKRDSLGSFLKPELKCFTNVNGFNFILSSCLISHLSSLSYCQHSILWILFFLGNIGVAPFQAISSAPAKLKLLCILSMGFRSLAPLQGIPLPSLGADCSSLLVFVTSSHWVSHVLQISLESLYCSGSQPS